MISEVFNPSLCITTSRNRRKTEKEKQRTQGKRNLRVGFQQDSLGITWWKERVALLALDCCSGMSKRHIPTDTALEKPHGHHMSLSESCIGSSKILTNKELLHPRHVHSECKAAFHATQPLEMNLMGESSWVTGHVASHACISLSSSV